MAENELLEALTNRDLDRARAVAGERPELALERDETGVLPALHALYAGARELGAQLLPPDEELGAAEAAAFGRHERLDALLEEDPAAANVSSPDGFSPVSLAIFGGQERAVRTLIEYGADVEAISRHPTIQVRPLQTAAFVRDAALGRILLDAGADPNGTAEGGFTALHSAAQNGDLAFARLLLEHGADTKVEVRGKRAVDFAEEAGASEVVELLRQAEAGKVLRKRR
jgi:ankyrin repeat protein